MMSTQIYSRGANGLQQPEPEKEKKKVPGGRECRHCDKCKEGRFQECQKPKTGMSPKETIFDNPPMRVGALDFGVLPSEEIERQAEIEISDRNLYDLDTHRNPTKHGPLDPRLGTGTKTAYCGTCKKDSRHCNGHWGFIRLEAPCFHIGFLPFTIEILNQVCKTCSQILLPEESRRVHLRSIRRPNLDGFQRKAIVRKIQGECKKIHKCPHCDASNGPVRKVPGHACKLVHLKFESFIKSTAKTKKTPPDKAFFDERFSGFIKANSDLAKHVKKAVDDLPAVRVHRIFTGIPIEDCELLGIDISRGRPESYLWTYLPVPPSNIRPTVPGDQATTEDELTTKLSEIIDLNTRMRTSFEKDEVMSVQMDCYEKLQDHIAMYINSHAPGLNKSEYGKAIRSFCSRLKGKQGRFRGNLSGKRVNFSGRTVISPDPNLSIEEVGIPVHVAKILTYPERVTPFNIDRLRSAVRNGPTTWPGAINYITIDEKAKSLKKRSTHPANWLERQAGSLEIGCVVSRHLVEGDVVLFNRQPSLHKLSILCHRVRIHQGRTFRFNECVCNPYNADFDGDEMNIHVPQTEEARAEAVCLMGVKHNLVTPKSGAPIIAPIQDFITAAYLLSNKDRFYTKTQFSEIVGWMFDCNTFTDPDSGEKQGYELPPPTILKPQYLWTGKQVFNVLMRPSKRCKVRVNVESRLREYRSHDLGPELHTDDGYLIIRNSEVMCGAMDKTAIGDGKKSSIFFVMLRDYGPDYAVQGMNRLAKLASRWLMQQSFSIGVGDVYPSENLNAKKKDLIGKAYTESETFIGLFQTGRLNRDPGCDEEMTLENKISKILSDVRQAAGEVCFEELSHHNAAVLMAKSGSKGSMINVSQMTAGVGQQMISQKRVENGFQDRTLPHFAKGARDPISKGFVSNSFFTGLTATEFLFHAMSGREGLVDTAVKTAETGYMSRRLIKSLEDAYVVYDDTVRNSSGSIIQFRFGDDSLDPAELEGQQKPVNFARTFTHALELSRHENAKGLSPEAIRDLTVEKLVQIIDFGFTAEEIQQSAESSSRPLDDLEGGRKFVRDLYQFMDDQSQKLQGILVKHRLHDTSFDWMNQLIKKAQIDELQNRAFVDNQLHVSEAALDTFIKLCWKKYLKSRVQPGHAVGAIAAQSIGEPGTQMTLKTFHFAGVAGMSLTQGVPRVKEIINAAKKISTPVITCVLENKTGELAARFVKSRIEKTYLRDISDYIKDVWNNDKPTIEVKIDRTRIAKLKLDINMHDIKLAIAKTKGIGLEWDDIRVKSSTIELIPVEQDDEDVKKGFTGFEDDDGQGITAKSTRGRRKKKPQTHYQVVQELRRNLLNVVVQGYPETNRAIIRRKEAKKAGEKDEFELLVEGYGLKACMTTVGVDGIHTRTNSVMETAQVLGIEAARSVIEAEIQVVMESMDIDSHHVGLLACIMTLKGEVLGITRFGMVKMRDSVLQLASFEKTPDHLFEAATRMKSDPVAGVSESIIMGQQVRLGTGIAEVVRPLGFATGEGGVFFGQREPLFEKVWKKGGKARGAVQGWQDIAGDMWRTNRTKGGGPVSVDADGDVAMQ